jgi:hypothetical protein
MGEDIGTLAFVLLAGGGVVAALMCRVVDNAVRAGNVARK